MKIDAYVPNELLSPFILTYLIIESEGEGVNKVLPDTSLVLAFRYKGILSYIADNEETNLPFATVSGLRKTMRLFNYSKNTGNILVLFKEAGAAAFFKNPLHNLYDETVSIDNFISHQYVSIIEEQLAESKDNTQRIALIEKFLLSIISPDKPDPLILSVLEKIHIANGVINIKNLANSHYISHDAFEKRFRRVVGTTPKQFSSIVRMKTITEAGMQKRNFVDLAFDAGYFDQPHFNKGFKSFTGQTPKDFFNSPSFLKINDFIQ